MPVTQSAFSKKSLVQVSCWSDMFTQSDYREFDEALHIWTGKEISQTWHENTVIPVKMFLNMELKICLLSGKYILSSISIWKT